MIVAAGVSAFHPLMEIAGVTSGNVEKEDIQCVVDVVALATRGNYVGPLIPAVTFVAVFDTRKHSGFPSSKAASLHLYQALAIEHPLIVFTHLLSSTIGGDFRASAIDGGTQTRPTLNAIRSPVGASRRSTTGRRTSLCRAPRTSVLGVAQLSGVARECQV
ncbi:hypothetical protein DFH08DRAFT_958666 [Mycena albidolilacea]|uniref:Uncharacterized protein n=1 Tax=Mycena albidolilacea TaxID=1033008 RepID=A0AAD7A610_9AGAR|nr:hypothetical protein DFH08DRAFT_958666 [Mycena albidolilacea]